MLLDELRRIELFAHATPDELRRLASNATVLCLPANRPILRNAHKHNDYFYLLKGRIETQYPKIELKYQARGELRPFFPGCARATTLASCQILRIDARQHEFIGAVEQGALNLSAPEQWLRSFLTSNMMAHLDPPDWARLLSACKRRLFRMGDRVVGAGESADCCFVIERGHAVVHSHGRTLCHLGPGDFFGEDALLLDTVRNAHITALDELTVHSIDQQVFKAVLVERLVEFVSGWSKGVLLNIGAQRVANAMPVSLAHLREDGQRFDPTQTYYVIGGAAQERALCAFILRQQGIVAHPVAEQITFRDQLMA